MPGFGHDPFGHYAFGEATWARSVLWSLIPEFYRQADSDGLLQAFTDAIGVSFTDLRHRIRAYDDLRDPLRVRAQENESTLLWLGPVITPRAELEQRGVDGSVNALAEFSAPTARFFSIDVGKELTLSKSSTPSNNSTFRIVRIINPTTILTDPFLSADSGNDRWEVRSRLNQPTGQVRVQVRSGFVGDITPGWKLTDGSIEVSVLGRQQFRYVSEANPSDKRVLTEHEGANGTIDSLGRFVLPATSLITFNQGDTGKALSITGSLEASNNGLFEVVEVLPGGLVLILDQTLTLDASPLTWALRPYPELVLDGTPTGVVEHEGFDGNLAVPGAGLTATITDSAAQFESGDVGKTLRLRGATNAANNGTFVVTAYVLPTTVEITRQSGAFVPEIGPAWELRASTSVGDGAQVQVRAMSLLQILARDFGIEVDAAESESRQRSWVRHVSQWIDLKGIVKSYEILGLISGFTVVVSGLYRVSEPIYTGFLPDAYRREIGDVDAVGTTGADGSLVSTGPMLARLTSPTAIFTSAHVGRQIHTRNTFSPANAKLWTILTVVDANTVDFLHSDVLGTVLPDGNNGAIEWTLVRLYATESLPPSQPNFDEVNGELMDEIVFAQSGLHFYVDTYCWETTEIQKDVNITITASSSPSPFTKKIQFSLTEKSGAGGSSDGVGNYFIPVGQTPLVAGDVGKTFTIVGVGDYTVVGVAGGGLTVALTPFPPLIPGPVGWSLHPTAAWATDPGDLILAVGPWEIVDGAGIEFFLETLPTLVSPGVYEIDAYATVLPTLGAAILRYNCSVQISCGYCKSNRALAEISAGTITSDAGGDIESALDRLLRRLIAVTPAHVELLIQYEQELEASLSMSASIETHVIDGSLLAPLTAFFDDIPADDTPVDTALLATVEPTIT